MITIYKFTLLWTDALVFTFCLFMVWGIYISFKRRDWRMTWNYLFSHRISVISAIVLSLFFLITVLDSIHFYRIEKNTATNTIVHTEFKSVLDFILRPLDRKNEKTYSAPFALHLYTTEIVEKKHKFEQIYPSLIYPETDIKDSQQKDKHIAKIIFKATLQTTIIFILFYIMMLLWRLRRFKTNLPWNTIFFTLFFLILISNILLSLSEHYHIFGTNKVGGDVFYETLKSVRTGFIIGTITTIVMLPFAILFGMWAGYFGGKVDDVIQYIYTTLSSIPGVLLISAFVLSLQIYIANHPAYFPSLEFNADARLLGLCIILGITSWTTLCRLLRAETLKLREIDFIQAAIAVGTPKIIVLFRHILPNVMHIILISIVLDFSALVLAEAVLSYVGVGVDPTTYSWGNMINSARLEMAREPIVWWPLLAAFVFMFTLVLSANLFADGVRKAFDPRLRDT